MDEQFFLERKIIGKGRQATVYIWKGFAYKVYPDSYPIQAIASEMQLQQLISKIDLPLQNTMKRIARTLSRWTTFPA